MLRCNAYHWKELKKIHYPMPILPGRGQPVVGKPHVMKLEVNYIVGIDEGTMCQMLYLLHIVLVPQIDAFWNMSSRTVIKCQPRFHTIVKLPC